MKQTQHNFKNSGLIPFSRKIIHKNKYQYFEEIYLEDHNTSTYPYSAQDQNFPHHSDSISIGMCQDPKIKWVPAQSLIIGTETSIDSQNSYKLANINYSSNIDNLQEPCFCNRSLTFSLLILNWFAPSIFEEIFIDRKIKPRYLYDYKILLDGKILKTSIDSYIPIRQNKHIFAQNIKSSIFPCLYEKLLAKIYGCYENIAGSMIDIVQIFTLYHKQAIPFYFYRLQPQRIVQMFNKAHSNQSLCFFRTRNSVRLQSVGLSSNCEYIITRLFKVQGKNILQFLEIDGTSWIGKCSKNRAFWQIQHPQIKQYDINISGYGRQNYMTVQDLIGVSRQFIILHNNQKYHKMSYFIQSLKQKHIFRIKSQPDQMETLIQLSFNRKMCRSLVFIISHQNSGPKIESTNFKKQKSDNFIRINHKKDLQYSLVIYAEDMQSKNVPFTIYIASQIPDFCLEEKQTIQAYQEQQRFYHQMLLQQSAPITYLSSQTDDHKNYIKIKNMYSKMGLGFILIHLDQYFPYKVKIVIDHQKLAVEGIVMVNLKGKQVQLRAPCQKIIVMKLKGNFSEAACFPPKNGIKFLVIQSATHFRSIFN